MGVRVRIRLCVRDRCTVLRALVNSGYESDKPELAIPPSIAEEPEFGLHGNLYLRKHIQLEV